ncbi:hypothetical protein AWB69_08713 [Caballeronia udeis]|uniref:Uncharacterized protein n=1 Tax=Caballeronia udeis TaxID=1232866 RepID=A0A158JTR6_9BURK|nr:hypothetical protein AWB69_08713 [Caballeronia udeis]
MSWYCVTPDNALSVESRSPFGLTKAIFALPSFRYSRPDGIVKLSVAGFEPSGICTYACIVTTSPTVASVDVCVLVCVGVLAVSVLFDSPVIDSTGVICPMVAVSVALSLYMWPCAVPGSE